MPGPLQGIKVIEMVGIGPCPFAAMMLADMGAEVLRIDRKSAPGEGNPYPTLGTRFDVMARGRRTVALDLKQAAGREATTSTTWPCQACCMRWDARTGRRRRP